MAWLPVGPTANEAAEIILLLVVVPFLFSFSLLVWSPTVSLLVVGLITVVLLFCAPSPREHGYPGQGPTAIAVRPRHERPILSAFHVTGPWI